jgi:transposase
MPKKIDPAVRERAVRLVREHRAEYSSLTAVAAVVARQERLGTETVRRCQRVASPAGLACPWTSGVMC